MTILDHTSGVFKATFTSRGGPHMLHRMVNRCLKALHGSGGRWSSAAARLEPGFERLDRNPPRVCWEPGIWENNMEKPSSIASWFGR